MASGRMKLCFNDPMTRPSETPRGFRPVMRHDFLVTRGDFPPSRHNCLATRGDFLARRNDFLMTGGVSRVPRHDFPQAPDGFAVPRRDTSTRCKSLSRKLNLRNPLTTYA